MRPIWKGAISFGMVIIPVKLYSAIEDKDIRFHLLHKTDLGPIQEKRFCTLDHKEVAWEDLVRGYEVSKGQYVVIEPEKVEAAEPVTAHTIEIGAFVELEEIDPIYFEKSYYLEPEQIGQKPFELLRRALDESGRTAVARVAIRTKERLATLRVYDHTLVLETMYWPDEIRSTSALETPDGEKAAPSGRELEMARTLVENLSGSFDPGRYTDRYREALLKVIEKAAKGEKLSAARRKPEPKVADLMAALEASVAAAKAGRPKPETARSAAKAPTRRRTQQKAAEREPAASRSRGSRSTSEKRRRERRSAA
jgi:DNA end-binding protein Ku